MTVTTNLARPTTPSRILIVEDNPAEARLAREWLLDKGIHEVRVAKGLSEALTEVAAPSTFAAVALDLTLPDSSGLATFRAVHAAAPDLPVVILTGLADEHVAVDALHEGAQDYLIKDDRISEVLPRALRFAIERHALTVENSRLAASLEQARRLEGLGLLAGGIAHEFNNLMGSILNNTEMLIADTGADSSATAGLLAIRTAATRAATLTRQLREFAQSQPADNATLDLNASIKEFKPVLASILGDAVTVTLLLAPGVLPIEADLRQVQYVLRQLAFNARDAMPGGGTFTIDTAATSGVVAGPAQAIVRIIDSGCGMDETTRSRCLQPFFTTKGIGRATGLGLATVHGIVTGTRGTVSIVSEPGRGTTIGLSWPLASAHALHGPSGTAEAIADADDLVLLIDDDDDARERTARSLIAGHFNVITARSGHDAIAVAQHELRNVSVILVDAVLRDSQSAAIVRHLTQRWPHARVVGMSGDHEPGTPFASDAVLAASASPAACVDTVRRVLGQ